jgi:hypothetical protein
LDSSIQYWDPAASTYLLSAKMEAGVFHELLHNIGFSDLEIQTGLNIQQDARNTTDITDKIEQVCFHD